MYFTPLHIHLLKFEGNKLKAKLVNRIACRRNGQKRCLHRNKFMVYHIQVHPLSVDTITIYPHDCTVGKSCNIFIYQFQRTLSLPELKI